MRFVKYSEEALRNPLQKQREKQQLADQLRVRGTSQIPNPPRDLFYQAGPRGALITWKLPESGEEQIAAWRVYRNTEDELYADVRDRGTTVLCGNDFWCNATSHASVYFFSQCSRNRIAESSDQRQGFYGSWRSNHAFSPARIHKRIFRRRRPRWRTRYGT
jgi:hypothetical protein